MKATRAAQIRRGILRAKRNANGQVVVGPVQTELEREADARTWARHLQRLGIPPRDTP